MAAVLRDTVLYDKLHVKKFLADARDRDGRMVPIPFELVAIAGEAIGNTYNLCVLPANCEVVGLEAVSGGLTATATVAIGDAGDPDRYALAGGTAAESRYHLAFAGTRFRPTADTIVVATNAVAALTEGNTIKGCFYVVPGA